MQRLAARIHDRPDAVSHREEEPDQSDHRRLTHRRKHGFEAGSPHRGIHREWPQATHALHPQAQQEFARGGRLADQEEDVVRQGQDETEPEIGQQVAAISPVGERQNGRDIACGRGLFQLVAQGIEGAQDQPEPGDRGEQADNDAIDDVGDQASDQRCQGQVDRSTQGPASDRRRSGLVSRTGRRSEVVLDCRLPTESTARGRMRRPDHPVEVTQLIGLIRIVKPPGRRRRAHAGSPWGASARCSHSERRMEWTVVKADTGRSPRATHLRWTRMLPA